LLPLYGQCYRSHLSEFPFPASTFFFHFETLGSVRPYTSPLCFAGSCVFVKQSHRSSLCDSILSWILSSFSLSYGVILPSSFTVVPSIPLCSYILPPVSVSCTVSFVGILSGARFFPGIHPSFLLRLSLSFFSLFLHTHSFLFSPPSVFSTLPSLFAFQLSIRDRLTLLTFLSL